MAKYFDKEFYDRVRELLYIAKGIQGFRLSDHLSPREIDILQKRFCDPHNMHSQEELAELYEVSPTRIGAIQKKAALTLYKAIKEISIH